MLKKTGLLPLQLPATTGSCRRFRLGMRLIRFGAITRKEKRKLLLLRRLLRRLVMREKSFQRCGRRERGKVCLYHTSAFLSLTHTCAFAHTQCFISLSFSLSLSCSLSLSLPLTHASLPLSSSCSLANMFPLSLSLDSCPARKFRCLYIEEKQLTSLRPTICTFGRSFNHSTQ